MHGGNASGDIADMRLVPDLTSEMYSSAVLWLVGEVARTTHLFSRRSISSVLLKATTSTVNSLI